MEKYTEELINELQTLKCSDQLNAFFKNNEQSIKAPTLPDLLQALLQKNSLKPAQVIKDSCLDTAYAYKIFSGAKKPSRRKVLALALAFKLTPPETQYLLKAAGAAELYVRNSWDAALIYALNKKLSVQQTNCMLCELAEEKLLEEDPDILE